MMRATRRHRGFTLLEVLVVLLIIGVLSSLAVLSSGLANKDGPLDEESRRLVALMQLANEEAVLRTEELALSLDAGGYQFLILVDNAWQSLEDDLLRQRDWPPDLYAELELEGREVDLILADEDTGEGAGKDEDIDDEEDDATSALKPQILFLSSGEQSPFTLTLTDQVRDARRVIKGSLFGKLELVDPDVEPQP